ncbi:sigma-70 family RNA polymerase sigma factor [Nocardioides daphniae]|uniref:RNA polymerase sigma factor n=1 Tax=Nocardioides daphniae TaxID=402297 RepID=A0A4P7UHB3_9ACTN|nr:sigma-70 family RNA polymerase sigma factor [Nocardioides daphniae]
MRPLPPEDPAAAGPSGVGTVPDLAHLLRQAARGDESAFARFYDLTGDKAYGLALRVVRNPSHAQEVTQEAYLDVWRQSARYEESRGSVLAWLLTIVHRKAVDRVRSVESSSQREVTWERAARPVDHDDTAETVHASLEGRRVRSAVAELTPVQRQAIELAYFGGYTHTEVATLLDVPLGTAKTRIRDGLIRLRDTLGVGS